MTRLASTPPTAPRLDDLVTAIRAVTSRHSDWQRTAQLAAEALRRNLPAPEVLMGDQPDPARQRSRLLHAELDGTFSIMAIVWPPGRITRVHDHVTWCAVGVIQGTEHEELFTLDEGGEFLVPAGRNLNTTGTVSGFAPPGDIHRVGNPGDHTAISVHVYGTDLSRIGSSARRYYDLPVRPA
jgi:predicted metal-dependent enzyme (double-stranded beta helix superfamily)